jgi:predicted hydrocarbon binding protein
MSHQQASTAPRFEGNVPAAFPLALLEAVRAHDHPGEVFEEEDLTVSMPRRLGLTGVVETQIMRYEAAKRGGRGARLDEVVSLIRLVLRRPDAEPILRETGQRFSRHTFRRVPGAWTALLHRAPNALGLRSARRRTARSLRTIRAGTQIDVVKPFTVRLVDATTARIADDEYPPGCTLITGLLEEQLLLATGEPKAVRHESCAAHGATECVWVAD